MTNIQEIQKQIELLGEENILCVFTTTSTFAPRGYDEIKEVAIQCKKHNLFHLINNAYGIYCTKICDMLNQACKSGSVDLIISSTDKNFMVPVGGSLIYSPNEEMINKVKKNYPGRASLSPVLDLFITLLEMGKKGYKQLILDRKEKYIKLKDLMTKIAEKYSERILLNPNNKISIAMTLSKICKPESSKKDITYLGSLFYTRQISGIRIIAPSEAINFNGYKFSNYGSHSDSYPFIPYCAFACALGITDQEITSFASKFSQIVDLYSKNIMKEQQSNSSIVLSTKTRAYSKESIQSTKKFDSLEITRAVDIEI
jgi:O-phospho-L-seryl-tRNASec:L-selenocysteinyl-tRNA synthase